MQTDDSVAFETRADAALKRLFERLETAADALEIDIADGALSIGLDGGAEFLVTRHGPSRQLWLSSPVSGGTHYVYDAARDAWLSTRDGAALHDRLAAELSVALGRPIDLS